MIDKIVAIINGMLIINNSHQIFSSITGIKKMIIGNAIDWIKVFNFPQIDASIFKLFFAATFREPSTIKSRMIMTITQIKYE